VGAFAFAFGVGVGHRRCPRQPAGAMTM
jgi:hypothetical protein